MKLSYPRHGSRGGRVCTAFVCVSVFPHDISKTDAARITKRDNWNVLRWVPESH